MPQIKEYRSQTSGPGVTNPTLVSGSDVSGGMGKNLQMAAETISGVNDYFAKQEQQQQDFQVEKIKMKEQLDINDYMQQLKMKAPSGADGFTEQAKAELDKRKAELLDSTTSEYMRKRLDSDLAKVHFGAFQEAMQFEAESKAKKDKEDVMEIGFRTKNAVRQNPAIIASAIESTNKLIDATRLDGTTKQIWKEKELQDLRQNEIRGWIDINPYKAKEMIQNGTWDKDLSDDVKQSMIHESNQGIRAAEIEKNRTKKLQDDADDAQREAIKDDFLSKASSGSLSAHEIVRNEHLTSSEKEHFLREVKNNSLNMKSASNPTLFNDMVEQINSGKITSDEQILKKLGNGLTYADVVHLRKELNSDSNDSGKQEKVFKKGLDDIAKGMLTKSNGMGFKDPEGDVQLQKWRIFAAQKFEEGKQKGLSITQMTDPDSKDFIGKDLGKFVKSQEQIMNSVMNRYKPAGNNGSIAAPEKVLKPWEKAKGNK